MLHNEKELFEQIILRTSESMGIEVGIVEKDYFVTLFLKKIVSKQPDIIFKGGTSLSKCYKLIKRFSEDIDLSIECVNKPTEGQKKHLKLNVVSIIDEFNFDLTNADDIRSRRDFNRYIIDYPSVFSSDYLKQQLIVETAVFIRSYPSKVMTASSFIYKYLYDNGYHDIITQYDLEPFELNVQIAERTLIDKIYALCDYYLSDKVVEHSRHIYDIYKLLDVVEINNELRQLALEVREERKKHKTCLSAQDGVDINLLLQEIIDKDVYKSDYESITSSLLFEEIEYHTAVKAFQIIVDNRLF